MLNKSEEWSQVLENLLVGVEFNSNMKNDVAAALMYICNEHFYSLLNCCQNNRPASAFALLRPQYESFTRGLWVYNCATDQQIINFLDGKCISNFKILKKLRSTERHKKGHIDKLSEEIWKKCHDFTHGGKIQISSHISRLSIASTYTVNEINSLIKVSSIISFVNSCELADLCEDKKVVEKLRRNHNRIFDVISNSVA